MNIYFIRHGETEENAKKTYYGGLDAGLSQKGINQCINARKYILNIEFQKVYISESCRTRQSAEILLKDVSEEFIIDKRLNELSFGDFEGKTYEEIIRLYPEEEKQWRQNWKEFCPPGGESYREFYERVKDFMVSLEALNEENILVITHGGVIRAAYTYIMGGDLDIYWKFASKNCDISLIKYEYGNWFIDSIVHGAL
jgi:alpha-ribazole phosphatase